MRYTTLSNGLCKAKAGLLSALLLFAVLSLQAQQRIYVSPGGTGNGTSWASTTNLGSALGQAAAGDELWLLGYRQITDPSQLYVAPSGGWMIPSGVKVYGGFAGTETTVNQRADLGKAYQMTYRSVLSGDISGDDEIDPVNIIFNENARRADNAQHVLVMNAFRDTGDNSNDNSYPTVVDGLTIVGGHADDAGGGIYVQGGTDCVPYSIDRCYFINNYAPKGGAVYVNDNVTETATKSTINQCIFYNNVAGTLVGKENVGGGLYLAGAGNIVNCSVFNNENGGVVLSGDAYLVNSTVARNTGGGVDMTDGSLSSVNVYNSVVWGNSLVYAAFSPKFSYSAYPDANESDGNNNIALSTNNRGDEQSPMFDAPSLKTSFDLDYDWRREAYPTWSWKLTEGSYLIDKGNNDSYGVYATGYNSLINTDLSGETRIVGTIDINAYEYQTIPASRIRYVKQDGSDTNDGSSWSTAYKSVQKAINELAAQSGVPGEVWVAAGTYEPTELIDGAGTPASFRMFDGISVYGGFDGTEYAKSERAKGTMPWQFTHETVLRGNTYNGTNTWIPADHKWSLVSASTHVVWFAPLPGQPGFDNITVLDGVTIEGGQGKTSEAANYAGDKGAGVYMSGGNVYLNNSVVRDNTATSDGGGIYLKEGRVQGCLVYNNSSEARGGGIYLDNAGLVLRTMITNNAALTGGGIYLDNNAVQADGMNHPEYQILSTSIVSNNTSVHNGAVYCSKGGVILQSTIVNNDAPTATDAASDDASQTGGLYIDTYAKVINSVLWNNEINDSKVQLYAKNASVENVGFYYSAISGMNNIVWNNTLQQEIISLSESNDAGEGTMAPGFSADFPTGVGVQSATDKITYFWTPVQGANLRARGMSLGQLPDEVMLSPELDITGKLFAQKPAIGAYQIEATGIQPADDGSTLRIYVNAECTDPTHDGSSWDMAYRSLNEAIAYMAALTEAEVDGKSLEICVMEGDLWPRYAYVNQDAKSATIQVPAMLSGAKLTIKGGYSSSNYGERSPLVYRSQINGNHEGKDITEGLYHCITVEAGAEVEFDGFHVINGYASGSANLKYGAGMLVRDDATVTLSNCIFENNTAYEGAAIDARNAKLTMNNCVVNNNTNTTETAAVINCPNLTMNFVTVINNVGLAYSTGAAFNSSFSTGNSNGNTQGITLSTAQFVNPTKTAGATLGFDTYLGGYSSFQPTNQNPVVNAGTAVSGIDTDIALASRSRGGAPDLGAYEADLPVDGTVIYVRTDGDDNNDGLAWNRAKKTVTAALSVATSGMEIWVAAGTYNERVTMEPGVNVLGGFAKTGNPTNKLDGTNRDISNAQEDFMTVIDGSSGGRVVTQNNDFTTLTTWEGLVIQNGQTSSNMGGAGVLLKNKGNIKNCLIQNNVYNMTSSDGQNLGGGGVRIEGSGIIENSIIKNNTVSADGHDYVCGGGLYLKTNGTDTPKLINCIIAENECINKRDYSIGQAARSSNVLGAAAYLTGNGTNIYNCTFAYNKADTQADGFWGTTDSPAAGGVWDASYDYENSSTTGSSFYNCIFWGNYGIGSSTESTYQVGAAGFSSGRGFNPKVYNCYISATSASQVTFGTTNLWRDSEQCYPLGDYASAEDGTSFKNACYDNAPFDNITFALKNSGTGVNCINKGNNTYVEENNIDLDAAGAARIQYCTVDKGAYESTDAITIEPDADGIYYVTQNGAGTSNGSSVGNASCAMELQRVLNAAGERAKAGSTAIVKIAGYAGRSFVYHANTLSDPDDPQSYTYVIPYGVTVMGGYDGFSDDWSDANRKPSEYETVLSAINNSSSLEQEVTGYHVVTFGEKPDGWTGNEKQTIIDGLYLTDGAATSMAGAGNPKTRGGGAIVPAWAHVRNCVISQCSAIEGGGLYLLPGATVSGTLIMNNTAEDGAGVYADNDGATADLRAHLISCTVTDNTATAAGGGIYLENEALLATNSVIWGNAASSDKNISGVVGTTFADNKFREVVNDAVTAFFPFNHCYVESYELPSNYVNSSMQSEADLYFRDDRTLKAYSELIKHGTTNQNSLVSVFGVASSDMQGIARIQNVSERIDVGAYAYDGGMIPLPKTSGDDVVTRIFVSQGSNVSVADGLVDGYIGRSFYTSLSWLDDALDYIEKVRSVSGLEDTPFDIYVAQGTYKPTSRRGDAATTTIDQRQNSFEIPSGVSIYGGFKGDEAYGYDIESITTNDGSMVTLTDVTDDKNRNALLNDRTYSDLNSNGVKEPWELANQTILSGHINVSPTVKNAYHVIYSSGSGSVVLDGLTVKDGETWHEMSAVAATDEIGRGGAIYTNGVDYTLKGCRVMNSKAVRGGGIYARDANLTIVGSVVAGNGTVDNADADGQEIRGGAVYMAGLNKAVALKAINTLWANNETTGKGGAIATSNDLGYTGSVTVSLMNNTIVRNKAAEASAVYATAGDITNTVMWGGEGNGVVSTGLTIRNSASDADLTGDNNIKLNAVNMAVDGPRFAAPSTAAGMAANSVASKWNPASISVLTDAGDGQLDYNSKEMSAATGAYKDWTDKNLTGTDQTFYTGTPGYYRYMGPKPVTGAAAEPKRIDIGLYEYQYQSAFALMDRIYVDTQEHGDGSGDGWGNATSDLRGAVVALSNPEGGATTDKEIFIRGGEYPQSQLYTGGIAYQAVLSAVTGAENKLTSLTIKGSYAENGAQDFSNPTVLAPSSAAPDVTTMFSANTNGKTLTVEGITFKGATGAGLDASNSGTLTLKNVAFRENGTGADVENTAGTTLIANALFADGTTGLTATGSGVTVLNATFANNTTAVTGTPAIYNTVAWNSGTGVSTDDTNKNVDLGAAANDDIENGPNFVDPDNGNYMIRPSIKLLNAADKDQYNALLGADAATTDHDLASNARLTGDALDIGAYEYNAVLQQIVYVKTNVATTDGSGTSWENPIQDLQGAVDLASIYASISQGENAYVFVHRDVQNVQNLRVTMPNVKVYGGMNDETGADAQAIIDARSAVLSNSAMSAIDGLTMSGTSSVVDGFKVSGTVNVSGGMLSTSVIESAAGAATVDGDGIVYNSFVRNGLSGTGTAVNVTSPAAMGVTTRTNVVENAAENGYVADDVWKYQLKENSAAIESGTDIQQYIRLAGHDKDLSGAARVRGTVDGGCFETWNITGNTTLSAGAQPTDKHVVYVRKGQELDIADGLFPDGTNFNVGFLLLEHGAGLRSNGNAVALTNFAVERTLDAGNNRWDVSYMPFDVIRTEGADGVTVQTYDGAERAAYGYRFSSTDGAWATVNAVEGYIGLLMQSANDATVRMYGNAYTESAGTPKQVLLAKYNNMEPWASANDQSSLRFTHQENMSWNMFGSPFLCAMNYDDMEYGRVIYKKTGDTFTPSNTAGVSGSIEAGSAVLTQTATLQTHEAFDVKQRTEAVQSLSLFSGTLAVAVAMSGEEADDLLELTAVPSDEASDVFNMAADGVKMMTVGEASQVYMQRDGKRYSLLSAIDIEGSVQVGFTAAAAGMYSFYIPEACDAEDYETVVLKDKVTGKAVDLLEGAYTFNVAEAGATDDRFTIAFNRLTDGAAAGVSVTALGGGRVRVSGLDAGSSVTAYATDGAAAASEEARGSEVTLTLKRGIYLFNVILSDGTEQTVKAVAR